MIAEVISSLNLCLEFILKMQKPKKLHVFFKWSNLTFFFFFKNVISECTCLILLILLLFPAGTLLTVGLLLMLPHLKCTTGCPDSCRCNSTATVECDGQSITAVPEQIPPGTALLQIHSSSVTALEERSLAGLDLMLRFSLTHSLLHTLHPEAFRSTPLLKSVKLSSNRLSSLPPRVFSPLTQLTQLQLGMNQLETIAPETFQGLSDLRELDLSWNRLLGLAEGLFDGLANLQVLNLGRNSIKKLPPTIFKPLTNMEFLHLYYNKVETLHVGMFDGLDKLTELKLHQNLLASLPPQVLWPLRKMKTLTLSANQLQTIPEKSFYYMPEMEKLTIYHNPLVSLPDQLMGHMPELKEFYLYKTNLSVLPANLFANMSGMTTLYIYANKQLSELPPDLFCCLPLLDQLYLKYNHLVQLHPQLFSRLPTLTLLHLNDNKLQGLAGNTFQALEHVSAIDLRNNQLTTLPGQIFSANSALKSLNLSGNPWDCGCGIRGISKWIRSNQDVVLDKNELVCNTRDDRARRTIGSLTDEDFLRCDAPAWKRYPPTQTDQPPSGPQSAPTPASTATPVGHVSHTTALPLALQASTSTFTSSLLDTDPILPSEAPSAHVFFDKMVLEASREYVHNNRGCGPVFLWFLPSSTASTWVLMSCHVLLVAAGVLLCLAVLYFLYQHDKRINELWAEL